MSLLLVTAVAAVMLLTACAAKRVREERRARQARRETAAARHPSRCRERWQVPGRPVDGEPLSAGELAEFTAIMRPAGADESAE